MWFYGPVNHDGGEVISHLLVPDKRGTKTQFIICGASVLLDDDQVARLICHLLDIPNSKEQ